MTGRRDGYWIGLGTLYASVITVIEPRRPMLAGSGGTSCFTASVGIELLELPTRVLENARQEKVIAIHEIGRRSEIYKKSKP